MIDRHTITPNYANPQRIDKSIISFFLWDYKKVIQESNKKYERYDSEKC